MFRAHGRRVSPVVAFGPADHDAHATRARQRLLRWGAVARVSGTRPTACELLGGIIHLVLRKEG
eukprot:4139791-Pyramimonas_sp.AAC.1